MSRLGRLFGLVGKFWDAFVDLVADKVPRDSGLRSDVQMLFTALGVKADATSFAMARADAKHEELEAEVRNYQALGRQAEEFLRDGDRESAERCITLQLQAKKDVERLTNDYEAVQRDATAQVDDFIAKRTEIDTRAERLPQLQADERYIRAQQKFEQVASRFDSASAVRSFDGKEEEIRLEKRALQNKVLLTADPHAELDRKIKETLTHREIQQAMANLEKRVVSGGPIDAEFEEVADPVAEAQKLLEAPRYTGLLSFSTQSRVKQY